VRRLHFSFLEKVIWLEWRLCWGLTIDSRRAFAQSTFSSLRFLLSQSYLLGKSYCCSFFLYKLLFFLFLLFIFRHLHQFLSDFNVLALSHVIVTHLRFELSHLRHWNFGDINHWFFLLSSLCWGFRRCFGPRFCSWIFLSLFFLFGFFLLFLFFQLCQKVSF